MNPKTRVCDPDVKGKPELHPHLLSMGCALALDRDVGKLEQKLKDLSMCYLDQF